MERDWTALLGPHRRACCHQRLHRCRHRRCITVIKDSVVQWGQLKLVPRFDVCPRLQGCVDVSEAVVAQHCLEQCGLQQRALVVHSLSCWSLAGLLHTSRGQLYRTALTVAAAFGAPPPPAIVLESGCQQQQRTRSRAEESRGFGQIGKRRCGRRTAPPACPPWPVARPAHPRLPETSPTPTSVAEMTILAATLPHWLSNSVQSAGAQGRCTGAGTEPLLLLLRAIRALLQFRLRGMRRGGSQQ